ncbi:MAG: DUF5318 domain-containing protein [Acidimicrobiia bacterium]|nr:DUF5318 domain-containing protein [Acidimicrobiia bacterium]
MYAVTDYSLARRAVLEDLRAGRVTRSDVCDAQQELLRAARNYGEPASAPCPVCDEDMVVVAFVFGDRLARNNGRVVAADEISRYVAIDGVRCYCVEVCLDCAWNHLRRSYLGAPAADASVDTEPRVT